MDLFTAKPGEKDLLQMPTLDEGPVSEQLMAQTQACAINRILEMGHNQAILTTENTLARRIRTVI